MLNIDSLNRSFGDSQIEKIIDDVDICRIKIMKFILESENINSVENSIERIIILIIIKTYHKDKKFWSTANYDEKLFNLENGMREMIIRY